MAISAATLTKYKNRWGEDNLAQITRRATYKTDKTIDEGVLEQAIEQAQHFVQQRKGIVEQDDPAVIEFTTAFLRAPDGLSGEELNKLDTQLRMLVPVTITNTGNSLTRTDTDFKGRYDGTDYEDDLDAQSAGRARRSNR